MRIEEAFFVAAPVETVWRFIIDPNQVGPCIPGCQAIEITGADTYKSSVRVGLGPIKASFAVEVTVTEQVVNSHIVSVTRGEEGSRASVLTAHNLLRLTANAEGTLVHYSSDISLAGRLGNFGLGVMKKKAKSLGEEFAQAFRARVEAAATIPVPSPAVATQSTETARMSKANWYDMREFLAFLEEKGDLHHFREEIDPEWEINGLTRMGLQNHAPALQFDRIKGADYPMVANLLGTDRRFLWALGIEKWSDFNEEWIRRTERLVPPRMVTSAPCQEVVIEGDDIDLNRICNVKWHQFDGGPFPGTLSVSVTKDPDTGVLNAGIYRMGTLGKNLLGWGAPEYTHGRQHYMKYERRNEVMPMAVITGYDPTVFIVSCTRTPPGVDEFQIAGGLRGAPLDMVMCQTIPIPVPATCEFVFEGIVRPHDRRIEGGFGEYTGHYGEARSNPVFEVQRVTCRRNPIYLGAREQWYPSESALAVGKSSQAEAFRTVRSIVPGVLDMRCDVTYECIVKIDKLFAGHAQQVIDAVWGSTYARYKHVIVVDKDIDIWDYDSVHWALSTRVRGDRDITISPRRAGQWLDPAVSLREKGWQTGVGIDATLCTEEYRFWGEEPAKTVDDPEMVALAREKWKDRLAWAK